jgi:hypothetical protein
MDCNCSTGEAEGAEAAGAAGTAAAGAAATPGAGFEGILNAGFAPPITGLRITGLSLRVAARVESEPAMGFTTGGLGASIELVVSSAIPCSLCNKLNF